MVARSQYWTKSSDQVLQRLLGCDGRNSSILTNKMCRQTTTHAPGKNSNSLYSHQDDSIEEDEHLLSEFQCEEMEPPSNNYEEFIDNESVPTTRSKRQAKPGSWLSFKVVLSLATIVFFCSSFLRREFIAPINAHSTNINPSPKVFVCITGQLPRLELAQKIDNLFLPWHEDHNVKFDVALVLTDTHHVSVNRQGEREQNYFTVTEVYDELSSLGPWMNVLNSELDVQSQDPVINVDYYNHRSDASKMDSDAMTERVQNHIRQFESLAQCSYHMSAAGKGPDSYNIVHRVREDSSYYMGVDFERILGLVNEYPKTVVSSECQTHHGINDRGSFVSPEAAYDYFNHPLHYMYMKKIPSQVYNTETFLLATYGRTCKLIRTDAFHLFRLWEKDGVISFSGDDLKCIERSQPGVREVSLPPNKRIKEKCREVDDGDTICVRVDHA